MTKAEPVAWMCDDCGEVYLHRDSAAGCRLSRRERLERIMDNYPATPLYTSPDATRIAELEAEKAALDQAWLNAEGEIERLKADATRWEKFVLNDGEWARFNDALENSTEPTQALIDLMKGAKRPSQDIPEGWRTDEPVKGIRVLGGRWEPAEGIWTVGVIKTPLAYPFTHWMPLPAPPAPETPE